MLVEFGQNAGSTISRESTCVQVSKHPFPTRTSYDVWQWFLPGGSLSVDSTVIHLTFQRKS